MITRDADECVRLAVVPERRGRTVSSLIKYLADTVHQELVTHPYGVERKDLRKICGSTYRLNAALNVLSTDMAIGEDEEGGVFILALHDAEIEAAIAAYARGRELERRHRGGLVSAYTGV